MSWDALYIVLGAILGWVVHVVYINGCEVKKRQWKPLNQRRERLSIFRR